MKIQKYLNLNKYYKYVMREFFNIYYSQDKTKIVQTNFHNVDMLIRANEDVGKAILSTNFEVDEIRFIKKWLNNDAVCFDVGANTGFFSLLIASKSHNIQVHSFDPIKINTTLLSASIEINGFENIVVNQSCVGNYDGTVEFSISSDSAYSSILDSGRKSELKKIRLPITQLDSYIKNLGISKIDFIKIDVEGAEKLVILGASEILSGATLRPKLMMIELFDANLTAFKTSVKEIVDLLCSKEYQPFVLENDELIPFKYEAHANKFYNIFFKNSQFI